jgi:hypothetical protein
MIKLNLVGNPGIFKSKKKEISKDQIQDNSNIHKRKTPRRYLWIILFVLLIIIGICFIHFDISSLISGNQIGRRVLPSVEFPKEEYTAQKAIESNATIFPQDTVYEVKDSQLGVRNNILNAFIELIDFLPESTRLQYLKADSTKVSFIFYIPRKENGYIFESKICKSTLFHKPEVFNIKYDELINNAPYQVMGIMNLKDMSSDDGGKYEFRDYRSLSILIRDIGKPLDIDDIDFDIRDNRQAVLIGKGEIENCIEFFKKIESDEFNLSIKSIFLFSNVEEILENSIVDFRIRLNVIPQKC